MNPDFKNSVPGLSSMAMSEIGYIKESSFLVWFKHIQHHRVPGPVVLILDGNATQCSFLALGFCETNNRIPLSSSSGDPYIAPYKPHSF
jgi:hypothetical protein